ncbi:GNAT family N-acetyltransferase [Paenibacillus sp.]|uniref:GNAT family N-acetyltransferase n=1 Tax=Paenibacillus sp. TaxID=58172 RepID=UPI002835FF62|nr:GNAT family N-acetyltransferase [Paenibacillus sp.]
MRHLYVLPKHRCSGVGKKLLEMIIEESEKYFRILTLYTENPIADKFYRNIGFSRAEGIHKASHVLNLKEKEEI